MILILSWQFTYIEILNVLGRVNWKPYFASTVWFETDFYDDLKLTSNQIKRFDESTSIMIEVLIISQREKLDEKKVNISEPSWLSKHFILDSCER